MRKHDLTNKKTTTKTKTMTMTIGHNLAEMCRTSPKDFAEVMAGFKPGMKIESETFMLGDTPLTVQVFPNGKFDEDTGYVTLILINNGDDDITDLKTINLNYTETVKAGW